MPIHLSIFRRHRSNLMAILSWRNSEKTFRVGTIYCLGRNYADHAREMNSPTPEKPVVFIKPSSAVIGDGGTVEVPTLSGDVHHEVEMVVAIGRGGRNIPRDQAFTHVAGYAVGLDMTLRDVQSRAKKEGLPWTVAKGFATSAPISTLVEKSTVPSPQNLTIALAVNGRIRQKSSTSKMIFPIDDVVSYLSTIFVLEPGDLVFTGTPEGVGSVVPGDRLEAELESVGTLRVGVSSCPS